MQNFSEPFNNQFYEYPGMQTPQAAGQQMMPDMQNQQEFFDFTINNEMQNPAPASEPGPAMPSACVQNFLHANVGKLMNVEFLLDGQIIERFGRLLAVGDEYILLQSVDPNVIIMCDIRSVRFASIVNSDDDRHILRFR